jgi:hypothetical protein
MYWSQTLLCMAREVTNRGVAITSISNQNLFGDFFNQKRSVLNLANNGLCYILDKEFTKRIRGRCYDSNFLRFSPIFGEKIGVFLKNQCYDQNFA